MASKLLLFLLPVAKAVAVKLVERLRDEAKTDTLPDNLKPYSAEILVVCDAVLDLAKTPGVPA